MHMPQKLLYVLPEVAYVVDPIPTKKPHTYAIRSFRQINGEFLDENEFISHNLSKLMDKLDKEQYQLVLPDYLFTNTIVNIDESDEKAAISQAKAKLLPDLGITQEEYFLSLTVVTQHRGISKVQLSALEKSLIKPLIMAAKDHGVGISEVVSLSWTLKSAISLEPSISVAQLGESAYLALHYIGVDQTMQSLTTEVGNLAETAKTLKGAEASIQTVYLISSPEVEKTLKAQLEGVLPVQQLTDKKASDQDIPSYVRQVIEIGLKTLSIEEYQLPKFSLSLEASADSVPDASTPVVLGEDIDTSDTETKNAELSETDLDTEDEIDVEVTAKQVAVGQAAFAASLPAPIFANTAAQLAENSISAADVHVTAQVEDLLESATQDNQAEDPDDDDVEDETPEREAERVEIAATDTNTAVAKKESIPMQSAFSPSTKDMAQQEDTMDISEKPATSQGAEVATLGQPTAQKTPASNSEPVRAEKIPTSQDRAPSVDLAQFSPVGRDRMSHDTTTESTSNQTAAKVVITDKPGISGMLKTFFIVVVTAVITIGVGIAIGLAYLQYSQKTQPNNQEIAQAPTPTIAPSPTPTPLPAVNRGSLKALVVNATTIAGHAGKVATLLEDAGYGTVKAANAKGEYKPGVYLLASEETATLSAIVNKDTKLTLVVDKNKKTEDPTNAFDIVVVLAE